MNEKKSEPPKSDAAKSSSGPTRSDAPPALAAGLPPTAKAPPTKALPTKALPGVDPSESTPAPAKTKRDMGPVLYLTGFVVLAGAMLWLWQNPPVSSASPQASAEITGLRQEVRALSDRVARLEQRPPPAASAPPDLAPLTARVAALEARKPTAPVDLGPLEAAIAALESRPVADPSLAARVESLSASVAALTNRVEAADTSLAQRLDASDKKVAALDAEVATLQKNAGQISALADRSTQIARIQAAQAALASGVKLGDMPGAPAALARYAAVAPPTEAALRQSFPAAADAALAASRPAVDDKPFLDRAWARAQELVTLRQGDHVILGDPAAGVLDRARAALDAGDLAGAIAALGALNGPAAAAMAGWKAQAQGLLDARKALADMAAHT
jgi:hypothetical protein